MKSYRNELQTIKRSKWRLFVGKTYYTLSRYFSWYRGNKIFACQRSTSYLPYTHFTHQSILLRQLKDVEMIYQYNKITNLKIAVKNLDGMIIKPGETLSYWKLIGKPTAKKGYVPGMVLYCGTYHMAVGGGLCQLSNLIYWMSLHTPLTITERYRHSYDVFPDANRTQPFGSGATCVYPYRDLMIRNDTDQDFQLKLRVSKDYLEGSWVSNQPPYHSYQVIERKHQFKSEHFGGFSRHNELYRKVYTCEGVFIREEYIAENHALMMYSPFLTYTASE